MTDYGDDLDLPCGTVLGFTGTQRGMTGPQEETFAALLARRRAGIILRRLMPVCLLHGCCVGSDADAVQIATRLRPQVKTVALPARPVGDPKRTLVESDVTLPTMDDELQRNRVVARVCVGLFATPHQDHEVVRSGTWATVRYASEEGKYAAVIWPDGSVQVRAPYTHKERMVQLVHA